MRVDAEVVYIRADLNGALVAPMNAVEIAETLAHVALLMELKGESAFKVRAFQNAARLLETLEEPLEAFVARCKTGAVQGIGPQLSEALERMYERGHLPLFDELSAEFPNGILEIFRLPGLGPKKIKLLYDELKIGSVQELFIACREQKVSALKGFSEKSETSIIAAIERHWTYSSQSLYPRAEMLFHAVREQLEQTGLCESITAVGDVRRGLPVVEILEILVSTSSPLEVVERFVSLPLVTSIVSRGEASSEAHLDGGVRARLVTCAPNALARELFLRTGSAETIGELSRLAKREELELEGFSGTEEATVFAELGLACIPPELREGTSVIDEAAALFERGAEFPQPIRPEAIRGVLHAHSTYSDGKNSLSEMARAARDAGFEYFGISDHSQSAIYANGLKDADIRRQHREIDELNEELKPFRIFKGIEADILVDGALDYPDEILARFDFVIASIHSRFTLSEAAMTERVIRAIQNPFTTILAHPTGRLLLKREGYRIDMSAVLEAAASCGVAVELNCNPRRLDLDWEHLDEAGRRGILVPLCPDAHSLRDLQYVAHGLRVLRKTRLKPDQILNTRSRVEMEAYFRARREGR